MLAAVESGTLLPERLESYRKLEAEAAYQLRRTDPVAANEAIAALKAAMKSLKHHPKYQARK